MKSAISFAIAVIAASSAFAQVSDAYSLRAKYGQPLDREIFTADYGPSKQVCKIQLPSGKKIVGTAPVGAITKDQINEVLNEVVPPSMRGKELGRMMQGTGAPMLFTTEYEQVPLGSYKLPTWGKESLWTSKNRLVPNRRCRDSKARKNVRP